MKRSNFIDSHIMDTLKGVDAGLVISDVSPDLGISSATFYKWRARYGGMDASMMARIKKSLKRRSSPKPSQNVVRSSRSLQKSGKLIDRSDKGLQDD